MLISIYHVPGTVPKALHVLSWNSHNNPLMSVLLLNKAILQMRKLKQGEVEHLAQGHTTRK